MRCSRTSGFSSPRSTTRRSTIRAGRHLHDGLRGQHRAEPEAARRQHQGARRGRRSRARHRVEGRQGLLPRRRQGAGEAARSERGRREHDEPRRVALRAVHEALEQPALRRDDCRRAAWTTPASSPTRSPRTCSSASTRSRTCSRSSRPIERLNRIAGILEIEVDKLQVDRRIQSRVKKQMEKAQKEYYLNEKMKAIQKELGRKDEKGNEVDELKKKIETGEDAEGRRGEGHPGAEAPGGDAADVGRSDRLAQLSRLADRRSVAQEDAGEPRPEARRSRSSTRITTGSTRSRSASSSSSPSARS